MKWTYQDYYMQPQWLIDYITYSLENEARELKRQERKNAFRK